MNNWTFQDFLGFTGSLIVSIGGASVIIIALAKWFGDFLASRLLQGQRFDHESELEKIKVKYQSELESTKLQLDKAKSLFERYSEKQFHLYNDLWKVLWNLKIGADELWENADPIQLPKLSRKLAEAKKAIGNNILIIEEGHYLQLIQLINRFEQFSFGKQRLVELRKKEVYQVVDMTLNQIDIRDVISQNATVRSEYDKLLMDIARSFRSQIKG